MPAVTAKSLIRAAANLVAGILCRAAHVNSGTSRPSAGLVVPPSLISPPRLSMAVLTLLCLFAAGLPDISYAEPPLDLKTLQGRVVYVDFWASWCTPCRQSFPWMQAMTTAHGRDGLTVIAINLDHDRASAERFLRQFSPGFEVKFDPAGKVAEQFNVMGMPTSVVVDRRGVVRFTHIGFRSIDEEAYENQLRQLLAEP